MIYQLTERELKTYLLIRQTDPKSAERYYDFQTKKDYYKIEEKQLVRHHKICLLPTCRKPFETKAKNRQYCSRKCSNQSKRTKKGDIVKKGIKPEGW